MVTNFSWLRGKIGTLLEAAERFKNICPGVYYNTGAWSVIKLLTILYFVPIYTRIIPKYFPTMRYIELLAGTGLCRIRKTKDIVAGSTLIAATVGYKPFDEYILVEENKKRAEALGQRMKTITPHVKIFNCNCNECIEDPVDLLGEREHYLAFVDCEGLDVNWSTMDALLSKPGDMLFTFQSQAVARQVGKVARGWTGYAEGLNAFFGDDGWKPLRGPDALLQHYMNKIREETTRKVVLSLPVKGPGGFRYDVILATRRTRGGNPWIEPMRSLRDRMERYRFELVEAALNILTGRQLALNSIF